MKALVKREATEGLWLEEVPEPTVGSTDVLVQIRKTGICGTDVHIYNWDAWARETVPVPMTIGHEFSGIVVDKGAGVQDIAVGDQVSGEGHIVCDRCRNCLAGRRHLCPHTRGVGVQRTGCFSEYFALPAKNVFRPHIAVPDEVLACFDPFGNAVHTALSFDLVGEDVLITGAGPIGILAAMVARHAGARTIVITDMNEYRLDLARRIMPGLITLNVNQERLSRAYLHRLGIHEGFDVGLEMSGAPQAFRDMLEYMIHGGHVAMLAFLPNGTAIDWNQVVLKGLKIKGIYGREIFETWYKGLVLMQGGVPLQDIITHRFHYTEFQKGFDVMRSGRSGKVVLDWETQGAAT